MNKLARRRLYKDFQILYIQKTRYATLVKWGSISNHHLKPNPLKAQRDHSLLHVDLFDLVDLASISGRTYTLMVVDDYTRFTWTIFMKKERCQN